MMIQIVTPTNTTHPDTSRTQPVEHRQTDRQTDTDKQTDRQTVRKRLTEGEASGRVWIGGFEQSLIVSRLKLGSHWL